MTNLPAIQTDVPNAQYVFPFSLSTQTGRLPENPQGALIPPCSSLRVFIHSALGNPPVPGNMLGIPLCRDLQHCTAARLHSQGRIWTRPITRGARSVACRYGKPALTVCGNDTKTAVLIPEEHGICPYAFPAAAAQSLGRHHASPGAAFRGCRIRQRDQESALRTGLEPA